MKLFTMLLWVAGMTLIGTLLEHYTHFFRLYADIFYGTIGILCAVIYGVLPYVKKLVSNGLKKT